MTNNELNELYGALLEIVRKGAPWAADQIEQTVREGKPVARQVRRSKGGAETVDVVIAPSKLRDDQFAATEELSASERALVALNVVERLLVDPPAIDQSMRQAMALVRVDDVLFAEPTGEAVGPSEPIALRFVRHEKLAELLVRVTREVQGVR
jgi:hypothetical protein